MLGGVLLVSVSFVTVWNNQGVIDRQWETGDGLSRLRASWQYCTAIRTTRRFDQVVARCSSTSGAPPASTRATSATRRSSTPSPATSSSPRETTIACRSSTTSELRLASTGEHRRESFLRAFRYGSPHLSWGLICSVKSVNFANVDSISLSDTRSLALSEWLHRVSRV